MGYYSLYHQCVKLYDLWKTAPELVKTFLGRKEREILRFRPRKRAGEIVLVLSLAGLYVYILLNSKVIHTRVTKFLRVAYHCTQASFCIILMFYAALGGPSCFLPLVRHKAFKGSLLLLVVYHF